MASEDSDESPADLLEKEIATLREEAANLRKTLQVECSTILSSPLIQKALQSPSISKAPSPSLLRQPTQSTAPPPHGKLLSRAKQQEAHVQQCLHRMSISVTAFKVHDPDPNAVDGGHVLGLRFEAMSRGQFLSPYYVMLNRPFPNSKRLLGLHRHTLPPAIPLAGLAARHLPAPRPESESESETAAAAADPPKQDLERFARALRREIARYHNRLGVSADLRRGLGLHGSAGALSPRSIVEVGIADVEAKQISLTWADDRSGRLVMDDDGRVVNFMVFGAEGRDWETAKEFSGVHRYERVEDVARMLEDYAAG